MDFDPAVLDQLDKWIRTKGGRVQVKLINEFYQKNQPKNKTQLFGKLHLLADCKQSSVHLVGNAYNSAEYLELKHLGSKPYRAPPPVTPASTTPVPSAQLPSDQQLLLAYPAFIQQPGYQYFLTKTSLVVKAVLDKWQQEYDCLALDFKGDIRADGKIALMQISNSDHQVLMIDTCLVDQNNPRLIVESGIKCFLENPQRVKVILDCARSMEAVRTVWGVVVENVFDLSRSFIVTKLGGAPQKLEHGASLVEMVKEFDLDFPHCVKPEEKSGWFKRPLTMVQLEYAARGIVLNCDIYHRIRTRAKQLGLEQVCMRESEVYARSLGGGNKFKAHHPPGNEVDWACPRCSYFNYSRRTTCKSCDGPKPKAKFIKAAAIAASGPKESARERQVEKLLGMGLTANHCYYYHIEGACMGGLVPGKECRFLHDKELKEMQAASLAVYNQQRARATIPAPAPAMNSQSEAQRLQELEDKAFERALQESLKSEQERLEKQRKLQEEEMARYKKQVADAEATRVKEAKARAKQIEADNAAGQAAAYAEAEAAEARARQAQLDAMAARAKASPFMSSNHYNPSVGGQKYAYNFPQAVSTNHDNKPPAAANEGSFSLSREIEMIASEVGIPSQWVPVLVSSAQATGATSEMKGVNLVKFAHALTSHDMPLAEQSKFIKEVYKRRTGKN